MSETITLSSSAAASASGSTSKANGRVNGHTPNGASASQPTKEDTNTSSESEETEAETDSESLDRLVEVCVVVLRQAVDLVDASLSEDEQLTQVSRYIPGSTIGKHLRHATDHFSLLLDSLSSSSHTTNANTTTNSESEFETPQLQSDLELNYDVRARGTPMESNRASARAALENCIARLQRSAGSPGMKRDRGVRLIAVTPYVQTFRTSFGRELWFAALHAVHHWSMVRVIAGEIGIQLDDAFGVAPSTLVYRGTEGPLGKAKI